METSKIQRCIDICHEAKCGVAANEAQAELAALRDATRWVPVTERLPERGVAVLLHWTEDYRCWNTCVAMYRGGNEWTAFNHETNPDAVALHWMEIPTLPHEINIGPPAPGKEEACDTQTSA